MSNDEAVKKAEYKKPEAVKIGDAEAAAKVKAAAADAEAAAEKQRILDEQAKLDDGTGAKQSPELAKAAEAEAARIADADKDEGDVPIAGDDEPVDQRRAVSEKHKLANEAAERLKTIAMAYAPSAPNEHVIFGNGGGKFTLGDLRAIMNVA